MGKAELIFNTVRSSFVDGWGVRTTIFLKGCPLRCQWCCNPEGQRLEPELKIIYERCTGCGDCISACPLGALTVRDGAVKCQRELCTGCGACIASCAPGALERFGELRTPQEMFQLIVKDKAYYDASGGGVTIGGGEASLFPRFCAELMDMCHDAGIPVAIDTCGYTLTREGLAVLERADLLLYDIKGVDPVRHRRDTGVDNAVIWDNLYHLAAAGKPEIIVRIPVIPGHNDDEYTLREIARRLSALDAVKRVDLICYHQYGMTKYRQLDRSYPMGSGASPFSEERQEEILELFLSYGLNAQLGG